MAHKGVYLFDEMPEFNRQVGGSPQPLKSQQVTVSRAMKQLDLPRRLHPRRRREPLPVRVSLRPAARL